MDYLVCKELYHHGIKGQKWGVRKFQNEDGSLTAEGKARYGYDDSTGKMSKEGKKQFKDDTKTQNRLDKPIGDAVGHGVKTGLATFGIGLATTLGGVAVASIGASKSSIGAAKVGSILTMVGDATMGAATIAGIGSGIARADKNIKMGRQQNGGK